MNIPQDLRYAPTHEWSRVEGDHVVVGITDHAQKELSDVVFVELPKVGQQVTAGKACAVVESVKAASDIYAPVSGEVVAVNEALSADPSLVNKEPYAQGWFFKIKASQPSQINALQTAETYKQTIGL